MLTFKHLAIEFGAAEVHMMFSPPRVWKQSCRDEQRTNKELLPINIPVRLWPQSIFSAVGCQKSRLGRGKLVELRMRGPSSGEGLVSSSDAHLTDHKRCRGLSTEPKMREREQLDGDYHKRTLVSFARGQKKLMQGWNQTIILGHWIFSCRTRDKISFSKMVSLKLKY